MKITYAQGVVGSAGAAVVLLGVLAYSIFHDFPRTEGNIIEPPHGAPDRRGDSEGLGMEAFHHADHDTLCGGGTDNRHRGGNL